MSKTDNQVHWQIHWQVHEPVCQQIDKSVRDQVRGQVHDQVTALTYWMLHRYISEQIKEDFDD